MQRLTGELHETKNELDSLLHNAADEDPRGILSRDLWTARAKIKALEKSARANEHRIYELENEREAEPWIPPDEQLFFPPIPTPRYSDQAPTTVSAHQFPASLPQCLFPASLPQCLFLPRCLSACFLLCSAAASVPLSVVLSVAAALV